MCVTNRLQNYWTDLDEIWYGSNIGYVYVLVCFYPGIPAGSGFTRESPSHADEVTGTAASLLHIFHTKSL